MEGDMDAMAHTVSEETKVREDMTSGGSDGAGMGNLFNEGSEIHFEGLLNEMEGSETLGIGFEESEVNTNEHMYDESVTNLFDESSIMQMNEDMDNLHEAYKASRIEVKDLTKRMKSRGELLEKMRSSYLRDVVAIKHCLNDVLTGQEKKMVMDEYIGRLPSLDLDAYLDLYKPPNTRMRMKKCDECGGQVDVVIKDSDHVSRLMRVIDKYTDRVQLMGVTIATQDAEAEKAEEVRRKTLRDHTEEKHVLYNQMKKLNTDIAATAAENDQAKKKAQVYRDTIRDLETEVERLQVKEVKLEKLEVETKELQQEMQEVTSDNSHFEDEIKGLQQELDEAHMKSKKLQTQLEEAQHMVKTLDKDLEKVTKEEKRFHDLSEFLEKSLEEKSVALVQREGELADLKEEVRVASDESNIEIEKANKVAENLADENKSLENANIELAAVETKLSEELAATKKAVSARDATIERRETELMALAAEVESLQEEIAALKQYVSNTVADRRTPGRKTRPRRGETEDEESDEEIIWHADSDSDNDNDEDENDDDDENDDENENEGGGSAPAPAPAPAPALAPEPVAPKSVKPTKKVNAAAIRSALKSDASKSKEELLAAHRRDMEASEDASVGDDSTKGPGVEALDDESLEPSVADSDDDMQSISSSQGPSVIAKEFSQERSRADSDAESITSVEKSPRKEPKSKKSKKKRDTGASSAVAGTLEKDKDEEFLADHTSKGGEVTVKVNAPTSEELKAAKVAPPTVQASSKKKVRHERRVVEETKVEVVPPAVDATPGELMMRDDLVNALKATLGSSNTKRALNACREMMSTYGKLVTDSLEALWSATLLSKRGMDLLVKQQIVAKSVMDTKDWKVKEDNTHAKLGDLVSDLLPIIGSDQVGLKLSEKWQNDIALNRAIAQLMIPTMDRVDNQKVYWQDYKSYFGESRKGYSHGLKEMFKALKEMTIYFDMQNAQCNTSSVDYLKDWAEAKAVHFDLDNRIKAAKAEMKKEMMVEMTAISKELGLANGRFDAAKAFSKTMEVKLETAARRVNELEQLPARVAALEAEIAMLKKTRDEQAQLIEEKDGALQEAAAVHEEKGNEAVELKKTMQDMQEAIHSSSKKSIKFEQDFIYTTQKKEEAEQVIVEMREREERRLAGMVEKGTDTSTLMADRAIQTDFMIYPMSLRTKFQSPTKKGLGHRPYSIQLVDNPDYAQDVRFLSEEAIAHGASGIKNISRGMLKGISKSSVGPSSVDILSSRNQSLNGGGALSLDPNSSGNNPDLTQGSTISHEVSVGTDPRGGIGVTVRASSPKEINRRQKTTTSEYAEALSEKLLSEIVLEREDSRPDSRPGDGLRSVFVSTPMSYLLGDDMSDELGHVAGGSTLGLDDHSVNSAASVGPRSTQSVGTNGSSHFTLSSNAVKSSLFESQFSAMNRDIRSPITSKNRRTGPKKQKMDVQRDQPLGRNNNSIPPLQSTSFSKSVDMGSLSKYNEYMKSAPAWTPGQDSLLAPSPLYKAGAQGEITDLKRKYFRNN